LKLLPGIDIEREMEKDPDTDEALFTGNDNDQPQRNDDEKTIECFSFRISALDLDPPTQRYQGKSRSVF